MNDIIFNSKKEKFYKLYVYINLLKLILPKIVKFIFLNQDNIPSKFIHNIDELFKIWRDKWEIFDHKFFQGLFIYTFNYNSNKKIESFYSNNINDELNKYSINLENLNLIEPQKIKLLGNEYGLDTDINNSEIISGLIKIKRMDLIMNLSEDIDGKEYNNNIQNSPKQETSKIQKILQTMENNININNSNEEDDEQTIDNNNINSNNNFNDIDGEPL